MNEMPDNLSPEEKEAWEKSLTAGSLPTWWKPNPSDPAAAPPAAAATPAAPPPVEPAPAPPAPEPLVRNAPPDWDHSRTAGSLPVWWKPGDPAPAAQAPVAQPAPAPTPAAQAPVAQPAAAPPVQPPPPLRDPEQTLHLERSALEDAGPAPAPAAPPVEQYQPTMVMGTFPAAPRKASVQVRSGPDSGARFGLEKSPLYVGRAPDNGMVVKDPATSRRHARFELRGQDYLVVDLGSANGTLVDGKRVVEQVLSAGAIITMGQNEFVVSIS